MDINKLNELLDIITAWREDYSMLLLNPNNYATREELEHALYIYQGKMRSSKSKLDNAIWELRQSLAPERVNDES